ncbi:MAG: sulfatase [Acidobacteriota bacterium]
MILNLDDRREGEWQELATSVVASSLTGGSPKIHVRSRPGRTECEMRMRGIRGEAFELEPDQELGLLKAASSFPGANPNIGMAKMGLMLPDTEELRVAAPFDNNFAVGEAILAPAPTSITFRVAVPDRSRLLFEYGAHRGSRPGDAVGFEVRVDRRWRDEEIIWTDTVRADDEDWYWHEAIVDLSRYAGQTIGLTLRTFAPGGGRAYGVWGRPTMDVPRSLGDPPNIIVIVVDTLRADRLSCYGFPDSVSPNIDRLAAEGIRFENTFAQSNWTRPSFASIFSGLTVESHGLVGMFDTLSPSLTTLAEHLRQAGWSTHGIAYKPALAAGRGFEQGFESYFNIPRVEHLAQENLRKAVEFLSRYGDRRFFLFLHFNDPHLPYTHPIPFLSPESRADIDYFGLSRPVWVYSDLHNCMRCGVPEARDPRFERMGQRMYVEEIQYLDDRIGELVDELKVRDLYQDSIIVFVSDHGESLWDHYDQYGHGGKNHHDELIRVPMFIKPHRAWGRIEEAVVTSQVRAFDLMPTGLELAGDEIAGMEFEAESLMPMLRNPDADYPDRFVSSTNESAAAVRVPYWKYIRTLLPNGGSEELFDLDTDPAEMMDVAGEHPEILRDLRRAAAEHILLRHGGKFVLVVGEQGVRTVRLRWSTTVELSAAGHIGLPLIATGDHEGLRLTDAEFLFEGAAVNGPVALLSGFFTPDGVEVDVAVDDGPEVRFAEFPVYSNGDLDRVLATGDPGFFVFSSPAPSYRSRGVEGGETRVDARQLEALQALGYVEE